MINLSVGQQFHSLLKEVVVKVLIQVKKHHQVAIFEVNGSVKDSES